MILEDPFFFFAIYVIYSQHVRQQQKLNKKSNTKYLSVILNLIHSLERTAAGIGLHVNAQKKT